MADNEWSQEGYISSVEDGNFDTQKKVTIIDPLRPDKPFKAQFNLQKKDGTPTKVIPLIRDSFDNQRIYNWTGTKRTVQGRYGPNTYYTINWGFVPEEGASQDPDDWGSPAPPSSNADAPVQEPQSSNSWPQAEPYDRTTTEIESAWAIGTLVTGGVKPADDPDGFVQKAVNLVITKRRVASELRDEDPTPGPEEGGF